MNVNRYLFSGKELQNQTVNGKALQLYDFGARNYDPVLGRWFNIDPHADKYYSISPYAYCLNTPVNAIDPDGRLVIFINGMHNGFEGGEAYWDDFDNKVMTHLNDSHAKYYDGSVGGVGGLYANPVTQFSGPEIRSINPKYRYQQGYEEGQREAFSLISGLSEGETIKVITHSMGAAYAKGLIQGMIDWGVNPSLFAFEADFAPFQPTQQNAVGGIQTYQYSHSIDPIAGFLPMNGAHYMNTMNDQKQGHAIDGFWKQVETLPPGVYGVEDGEIVPKKRDKTRQDIN